MSVVVTAIAACQTTKPVGRTDASNLPGPTLFKADADAVVYEGAIAALRRPVHLVMGPHPASSFAIIRTEFNKERDYTTRMEGELLAKAKGTGVEMLALVKAFRIDDRLEKPDLLYQMTFDDNGLMVSRLKRGKDFDRLRWELLGSHPTDVYEGEFVLPQPVGGFEQDRSYGLIVEDAVGAQEATGAYRLSGAVSHEGRPSLLFDFEFPNIKGYRIVDMATGATVLSDIVYKTKFQHIRHRYQVETAGWPSPGSVNDLDA